VKRLNNGNALGVAGVVSRRRDERKDVVKMRNVRPPGSDEPTNLPIGTSGPENVGCQAQAGHARALRNLAVRPEVDLGLVTMRREKCSICVDGAVFAARELIRIV
jgi:hypothetical protein